MSDIDPSRILAAAKAGYPELWPEDDAGMPTSGAARAQVSYGRQAAVDRITAALTAYEAAPSEGNKLQSTTLIMPEKASILQQTLATTLYYDEAGNTNYVVHMLGEGSIPCWLGLAELAKDYVFKQITGGNDK